MSSTSCSPHADVPARHELRGLLRVALEREDQDVFRRWHRGVAYWGLVDRGCNPAEALEVALSELVNSTKLIVEKV